MWKKSGPTAGEIVDLQPVSKSGPTAGKVGETGRRARETED